MNSPWRAVRFRRKRQGGPGLLGFGADRGQVHEPNPVGEPVGQPSRRLQRRTGLAAAPAPVTVTSRLAHPGPVTSWPPGCSWRGCSATSASNSPTSSRCRPQSRSAPMRASTTLRCSFSGRARWADTNGPSTASGRRRTRWAGRNGPSAASAGAGPGGPVRTAGRRHRAGAGPGGPVGTAGRRHRPAPDPPQPQLGPEPLGRPLGIPDVCAARRSAATRSKRQALAESSSCSDLGDRLSPF
jgi:hypothetical protein